MSMPNEHRTADHTNRPEAFNPDATSIFALQYSAQSREASTGELDMFTRWIRLSDRALAVHRHKKAAGRGRRKCKFVWCAKLA